MNSGTPRFPRLLTELLLLAGLGLGLVSCQAPKPAAAPFEPLVARFFIEARGTEGARVVTLPQSEVVISVEPKPVVMEFDITDAEVAEVPLGRCLLFRLTTAAARDLYRLTGGAQGRRLVLALNDRVIGARKVDRPLEEGVILVFVEMPDSELPGVVDRLKKTSAEVRKKLAR